MSGVALIVPLMVLGGWWGVTRLGMIPEYLLPPPAHVMESLAQYVLGGSASSAYHGRFVSDLGASLFRVGCGFGLAALLGLPLGLMSGRAPVFARLMAPLVNGLRAVPGICWLPLSLVWLGIGFRSTLFLIALAAFFPIYLNAASGASSIAPVLTRAGAMLGLSGAAVFFRVVLPAAMPHVRTGLRLGLGVSFAYLVLGELTGVPDGIGAMIMDARLVGRVDMILAGIILISLLGWIGDLALVQALRAVSRSARRM
jgi:NitT/TauT family transport system permease protein